MNWKQAAELLIREIAADDVDTGHLMIAEPGELGLVLPPDVGGLHSPTVYSLSGCDPSGFGCVVQGDRFDDDRQRIGAVLHELAHRIDDGPVELDDREPPTAIEQSELAILIQLVLGVRSQRIQRRTLPAWYGHGSRFVRIAAVLADRANRVCEAIRPSHLRYSSDYTGLSEGSWLEPLADDLRRSGSIRAIISDPPPEPFRRAWRVVAGESI